jgi:cob(I)alamin adenosyltransferase
MAIRLTRIYTRTGDKGLTALVGGARVPKESARLEAYGTVDELNSIVGIVRTYLPEFSARMGGEFAWYSEMLRRLQNELFDVGSELATPAGAEYDGMHRMGAGEVGQLEAEMDRMQRELEPLKSFTLPGGGVLNAYLHQARTVCRRAERVCWRLAREEPVNDQLIIYINRLSDHLFVQSRWISRRLGEAEFLWDRGLRIGETHAAGRKIAGSAATAGKTVIGNVAKAGASSKITRIGKASGGAKSGRKS